MQTPLPTLLTDSDAAASADPAHEWPPLTAAVLRGAAHCEPVTGGARMRGGPRMVPQEDENSLPHAFTHCTPGYVPSGPMFPMPCAGGPRDDLLPTAGSHAAVSSMPRADEWPTTGVAYVPYGAQPDARLVLAADGGLEAALRAEIARLARLSGVPARRILSPLTVPPVGLSGMEGAYGSPNGTPTVVSYASYESRSASPSASRTSSSGGTTRCSLSSADTDVVLPRPAAEVAALGGGQGDAKQPDIFSGKEISSLYCSCEKDAVGDWDVTVIETLSFGKRTECALCLQVSPHRRVHCLW